MKKLLLKDFISMLGADLCPIALELYKANEKGEVFEGDSPAYIFELSKEYYLNYYHIKNINKKGFETLQDFKEETRENINISDLVVIGLREPSDCEITDAYNLAVCVKY